MNTHPGLKPTSSPSLSVSSRIVLVVGAALLVLALIAITQSQRESLLYESEAVFYFAPEYDNRYDNPQNWTPSYPGLIIGTDTSVVLQGLTHMEAGHLKVSGTLRVALGATLFAPEAQLTLQKAGAVYNAGELLVQEMDNHGIFINEIRATTHSERYEAYADATTQNKKQGRITVTRLLRNQGKFTNAGLTQVREHFDNQATFDRVEGGQLLVKGKAVTMLP